MTFARAWVIAALMVAAAGMPMGCSSGVVGGDCRSGYIECHGRCLDPSADPSNCGDCDNACTSGECVSGQCTTVVDASTGGAGGSSSLDGGSGGTSGASAGGSGGSGGALTEAGAGAGGTDAGRGGAGGVDAGRGGAGGTGAGGTHDGGSSGGTRDAGSSGGGDASVSSGGSSGALDGSPGGAANDAGSTADGGCQPPFETPENCGACNVKCGSATPLCAPSGASFACTSACVSPLVECRNQCVDTDNDQNNCGRCGHRCVSGLCQSGTCVGATAGHEVLFCMDYRSVAATGSSPEQLLENAVFLGSKNPVAILSYGQYAPSSVITAVGKTLDNAAAARARSYTLTKAATSAEVVSELSILDYDLLLVYDEPNAPAGMLGQIGTSWASAVDSFTRSGGAVVVLAGDGGRAEMLDLVVNAGLFTMTGQTSVTNAQLYDRAPGDAVGINVLSPFRAPLETCTFTGTVPDATTSYVVTDTAATAGSLGNPVVLHRVVSP